MGNKSLHLIRNGGYNATGYSRGEENHLVHYNKKLQQTSLHKIALSSRAPRYQLISTTHQCLQPFMMRGTKRIVLYLFHIVKFPKTQKRANGILRPE